MPRVDLHTALHWDRDVRAVNIVRKVEAADSDRWDQGTCQVLPCKLVISGEVPHGLGPVNIHDVCHGGRVGVLKVEVCRMLCDPADVEGCIEASGIGFLVELRCDLRVRIIPSRDITRSFQELHAFIF